MREDSPYLFRASQAPLTQASPFLAFKEATLAGGMIVRYQERRPGGPASEHWCETGHTVYVLAGRLRYEFPDGAVEAGPGDIVHIPAGHAHRHRPGVVGSETVRYVLTEFA